MTLEHKTDLTSIKKEGGEQEFAIDVLLADFHASVDTTAKNPQMQEHLCGVLQEHNPKYFPVNVETWSGKAKVLSEVVAGVYAPLIHGFSNTLLKNIEIGNLPGNVIAPPRDAESLAVSMKALAGIHGIDMNIYEPPVNRRVAGIQNNQYGGQQEKSPYFEELLNQLAHSINGMGGGILEVEPGIYGTLSPRVAAAFKERGCEKYVAAKLYGLGPNNSYVHFVLSDGKESIAEIAEQRGLVDREQIGGLMTMIDSLEELGMQNATKTVEQLCVLECGTVVPVVVPSSLEDIEIARVTKQVVRDTAVTYVDMQSEEVKFMLDNFPTLVAHSNEGLPLSLKGPIPSMDSKEEHFQQLRKCGLLDYPQIVL